MCRMVKRTNQQMIERTYERLTERTTEQMNENERTNARTNERNDECVDDTRTWIYVCIYVFCRRCCWRLRGGDGVVNGCVVN